MSHSCIAAVTGANKGIGLAIVRNLALQYPQSSFNNGPFLIYLTARDKTRGQDALKSIQSDSALKKARALAQDGGLTTVKYQELDIADDQSINSFANFLKKEHPDGIDMLINNAGIAEQGFHPEMVDTTLKINYYGTLHTTLALLPHLRPGGRLVNVSSMAGKLNKYSPTITSRFRAARSVSDITTLMQEFSASVHEGRHTEAGWPSVAYSTSKAGVTGMTRVLAREVSEGKVEGVREGVLVNSCCPGYVKTDMTKGGGAKTPDQGARTPVMLALGELGGKTGEFWEHGEVSQW
ncbi:carbonyl reductase [Viridothelium virens]|uniref:Carbonyl reductase n=1 Tax=Viridothelium virens TaxID=1048519 RepID=A0A6A6H3D6_VIRVR|nr:carbonyl reductase [Viridothelium virens]